MWGRAYFAARYFAARFWGDATSAPEPAPAAAPTDAPRRRGSFGTGGGASSSHVSERDRFVAAARIRQHNRIIIETLMQAAAAGAFE